MTSKRTKQPWMSADDYGRAIPSGLSVNLLVTDMEAAINFQRQVLGCEIVYDDEDFAVVRGYGAEWLLHTDHTYDAKEVARLTGIDVAIDHQLATLKHGVTKYRITLSCRSAQFVSGRLRRDSELTWVLPKHLDEYPLSVTGRTKI